MRSLTFHVRRERLLEALQVLRDELRFELCSGVSGVHYLSDQGQENRGSELHAVYHLLSMTYNRRVRVETSAPDEDPHVPSAVGIYPTLTCMSARPTTCSGSSSTATPD